MEPAGTQRLAFAGALTLRGIDAARARLRAALGDARHVVIDCAGVDEADVSFIQLLLAARVSTRASGGTVRLAAPPAGALLDALTRAGFSVAADDSAPGPAGDQECFWFAGGRA